MLTVDQLREYATEFEAFVGKEAHAFIDWIEGKKAAPADPAPSEPAQDSAPQAADPAQAPAAPDAPAAS